MQCQKLSVTTPWYFSSVHPDFQTMKSIFSCLFVIPSHIDNEEKDCLIPFQIYFLTLYRNVVSLIRYVQYIRF